jgi:hypothetical protein
VAKDAIAVVRPETGAWRDTDLSGLRKID